MRKFLGLGYKGSFSIRVLEMVRNGKYLILGLCCVLNGIHAFENVRIVSGGHSVSMLFNIAYDAVRSHNKQGSKIKDPAQFIEELLAIDEKFAKSDAEKLLIKAELVVAHTELARTYEACGKAVEAFKYYLQGMLLGDSRAAEKIKQFIDSVDKDPQKELCLRAWLKVLHIKAIDLYQRELGETDDSKKQNGILNSILKILVARERYDDFFKKEEFSPLAIVCHRLLHNKIEQKKHAFGDWQDRLSTRLFKIADENDNRLACLVAAQRCVFERSFERGLDFMLKALTITPSSAHSEKKYCEALFNNALANYEELLSEYKQVIKGQKNTVKSHCIARSQKIYKALQFFLEESDENNKYRGKAYFLQGELIRLRLVESSNVPSYYFSRALLEGYKNIATFEQIDFIAEAHYLIAQEYDVRERIQGSSSKVAEAVELSGGILGNSQFHLDKSVDLGYKKAQFIQALRYLDGSAELHQKGFELLEKSAQQDYCSAQLVLAKFKNKQSKEKDSVGQPIFVECIKYFKLHNYSDADIYKKSQRKLAHGNKLISQLLLECAAEMGNKDALIQTAQEYIKGDKLGFDFNRADELLSHMNLKDAPYAVYLRKLLAMEPQQAQIFVNKKIVPSHAELCCEIAAISASKKGQSYVTDALKWYDRTNEFTKDYPRALFGKGVLYAQAGDWTRAEDLFRRASVQGYGQAHYNLGILSLLKKDAPVAAVDAFVQAKQAHIVDAGLWLQRAQESVELSKKKEIKPCEKLFPVLNENGSITTSVISLQPCTDKVADTVCCKKVIHRLATIVE